MVANINELRTVVSGLLLELETGFPPDDAGAARAGKHATRLRFALDRVDELAHGAVMQSPIYRPERLEMATAILEIDIDRARDFIRASFPKLASTRRLRTVRQAQEEEQEQAKLAA